MVNSAPSPIPPTANHNADNSEEINPSDDFWAGENSVSRINALTFENHSSGGLNVFTGESTQTFESWARKFMDYIEATGRKLEEADKIGRLKMMLEGTPRDIFEDLPPAQKATLQSALVALKTALDTPFKSQLAKQSLATCKQKEGETVDSFVERLIPLVNAAYQELDPRFRKDMLKSAFLEKKR
uniref:Retrotransposon gag domain-containing protein n=1 Tax=Globodera rostochiensis TaxID=31243 RepID=A0A914H6E3_GLORO